MTKTDGIRFFRTATAFRRWLCAHCLQPKSLLVGFNYKSSGRGGLTYPEALDEALCHGWIDGMRRRLDSDRYSIRFSPRRQGSIWSRVNVRHFARLRAAGRVHPHGLAVFLARPKAKTGSYSYEKRPDKFPGGLEKTFRASRRPWAFWLDQPPGYRRALIHWVSTAKLPATQERRLQRLIDACRTGRRLL